ncbi:Protein kinase [Mycena sanguinolenta]|uniref:Protein kinase n=1 Tax=Mycena sanguinolenta TaxID=230812 RepID=A0A8H6XHU2_9AGAR|nr:Protein kinase [Mycena sanguinolenta]
MTATIHEAPCLITELTTAAEFGDAFRDVFQSCRGLYENSGLVHGDIRLQNLKYWKQNGKTRGVLVDLDEMDEKPRKRLKPAQETRPYMSLELLHPNSPLPPVHYYRFDLESLFYAMLFVSCHYHEGKEIAEPERPFEQWLHWRHLGLTELYRRKSMFLSFAVVPVPTSNFAGFVELFHYLRKLFRDGYLAQADVRTLECAGVKSTFDPETLGGRVTFDTFQKILDEHLPSFT